MALDLTAEQRQLGKDNFQAVSSDLHRRGFMKSVAAAGAVAPVAAGAYFGYESLKGKPVKAALIGCGDEGGVLLGEHNPDYIQFIAACDIRPYNRDRILNGDPRVPLRKGFRKIYGDAYTDNVGKAHMYTDYRDMLAKEKDIEAVVIALPLHLHAPVSIECMNAGKHVLCEKLMARTITQCKEMIAAAKKNNVILSIGHQRHYSMLYAHATEVMHSGVLGDVKHIRALWHRNNTWPWVPNPSDPALVQNDPSIMMPMYRDGWFNPIFQMDYDALKDKLGKLDDHAYGYKDISELIRWRLFNRTGGGLMAELGSHQLDACSIFLGKVQPLAVQGVGVRSFYDSSAESNARKNPRTIDDHVFVTFEFPGKNHPQGELKGSDKDDVVVVTYSSISTNGLEQYGECVMGSRGSMIVEGEQSVLLYKERDPNAKGQAAPMKMAVGVANVGAGKPVLESASTWGGPPPSAVASAGGGAPAAGGGPVSRGYKEEMEDFAYCIRQWDAKVGYAKDDKGEYRQRLPRCDGEHAMADAILALTANLAMDKKTRIVFQKEWFESDKPNVPDAGVDVS